MSLLPSCAALIAVLLAPASAQEPQPPPAAFDFQILPMRHDGAPDTWSYSLPDTEPKFSLAESVCPGETVTLLVVLKDIGDDGKGEGRVTLALHETLPGGETGRRQDDLAAWSGKLPPPGAFVLSRSSIGLGFDAGEPLGKRTFTLIATDAASGVSVEHSVQLELVKWIYGHAPATPAAFEAWSDSYHRAPQPAQAVRAFLEFGELTQGDDWNYGVVGLFRTIFTDDPWLLDHLIETAKGLPPAKQSDVGILLALVGRLDRLPELYPDPEAAAKVRKVLGEVTMPDAYGELKGPQQLDLLWGEFFGSGRYRPVRQVVRAFEIMTGGDPVALFKMSEKSDEDKALLQVRLAAQSAVWSFNSNVKHHEVVRQYARWMTEREDLSEKEKVYVSASLTVMAAEDAMR